MKTISTLSCIAVACAAAALSGCVVVPASVEPAYGARGGAVYVAPTYAAPGAGYAWQFHAHRGWGWRHPHHGWHRGWQ